MHLPYQSITFPEPPAERPYVFFNMVTTIDGKTVSNTANDPITLGSKTDYAIMRFLETKADAILIGAGTLRSTPKLNYPTEIPRIVISASAELDFNVPFFTEAPGKAYVATEKPLPEGIKQLPLQLPALMKALREMGIKHLLCEGGSNLNGDMIRNGFVDELFLTLAPKIKLGTSLPTYAGGEPLPENEILNFDLVESHVIENEIFVRYRIRP